MRIYLIGNHLLNCDSMPLQLKPYLEKALPDIKFLEFDPTEDWPDESNLIFIDTVINIKDPKLFTNIDDFESAGAKNLSVHGFDFYQELKLRKKAGSCEKYYIIGVPTHGNQCKIIQEIIDIINCNF